MSAQREDAHRRVGEDPFEICDSNTVEILCECGHSNCCGRIVVSLPEYDRVRRHPARFFIRAGHEVSGRQRVVGQGADYVVVEGTSSSLRSVPEVASKGNRFAIRSEGIAPASLSVWRGCDGAEIVVRQRKERGL